MQKKRLAWPDIAKAIAMLLVIAGHSTPPSRIYSLIFSFHMPFFFIMSGYFYKYRDDNLKKDFLRLICPYILCIAILGLFLFIDPSSSPYEGYKQLIVSSIYASGSGANGVKLIGALWFLQALFIAKRLLDFIFITFRSEKARLISVLCLLIVSVLLAWQKIYLPLGLDVGMMGAVYLYAGYVLKNYCTQLIDKAKPDVLIVLIFSWYITYRIGSFNMSGRAYVSLFYVTIPGSIAASILLMIFSKWIGKLRLISKLLSKLGQHTLLLLCIHDLDWRLPFSIYSTISHTLIFSFHERSYYWVLKFMLRFGFDLAVMLIILLIIKIVKSIRSAKAGGETGI